MFFIVFNAISQIKITKVFFCLYKEPQILRLVQCLLRRFWKFLCLVSSICCLIWIFRSLYILAVLIRFFRSLYILTVLVRILRGLFASAVLIRCLRGLFASAVLIRCLRGLFASAVLVRCLRIFHIFLWLLLI